LNRSEIDSKGTLEVSEGEVVGMATNTEGLQMLLSKNQMWRLLILAWMKMGLS